MRQDIYDHAIRTGATPRLAEMLACQKAPSVNSDQIGGLGVSDPLEGVHPDVRPYYVEEAKKAGVSISGKKYLGSLADRPGDPKAYVDSYSEARRVIEDRGWSSSGKVNVEAQHECEIGLPSELPIADDIIEDRAMDMMQDDGCDGTCTLTEWKDAKDKALGTLKPAED